MAGPALSPGLSNWLVLLLLLLSGTARAQACWSCGLHRFCLCSLSSSLCLSHFLPPASL